MLPEVGCAVVSSENAAHAAAGALLLNPTGIPAPAPEYRKFRPKLPVSTPLTGIGFCSARSLHA
jgi:hypothetical protein